MDGFCKSWEGRFISCYTYQSLANQIAGKLVGTHCHVINIYKYLDCYMKPELTGLDDKGRSVLGWNTGAEQAPNDKPPQFSNNSWSAWTQESRSLHIQIKTSKCRIIGKHLTLPTRFSTASLWQFEEMEVGQVSTPTRKVTWNTKIGMLEDYCASISTLSA